MTIRMSEINLSVPYIVHESAQARHERNTKRLVIALVITILLMFASNALWLWAWMQYDYVSETNDLTYTQDGNGTNLIGASVIGGGNIVTEGEGSD